MSFQTTPGEDPEVAGDLDATEQPSHRLPLFAMIIAGYRFVGEHLLSFAFAAILVACIQFIRLKLESAASSLASPTSSALLYSAVILAGMVFSSAVFAVFGTGWYRRQLLGRRRPPRFGPQELRFAVAMILFYLVLTVPAELSWLDSDRTVMTDRLEELTGYPAWLVWPTIDFLWRVSATALLFFAFPAIALDVPRPLAHAMNQARRALPTLLLFYLIGLVPWFALDRFGVRALVDLGPLLDEVNLDRMVFARMILTAWMTVCTLALAGAAYKEIAERGTADRLSAAFD
jgi:hypothetical protein